MPKSTMSITNATRVTRVASEEKRVIRIVPARWYEAPQIPNSTERPASPAADYDNRSVSKVDMV